MPWSNLRPAHGAPAVLVVLTLLDLFSATAQVGSVRGTVVDAVTGAPVEFANVFLAQTTSGTSTDSTGTFVLRNVPPGAYELIASRVGYVRSSRHVEVSPGAGIPLSITLSPKALEGEEVEVVGMEPEEWHRLLGLFTPAFIGQTESASSCRILNPQHLEFTYDKSSRLLSASCDTILVFENLALGYRVECDIELFEWDVAQDIGRYILYPRFIPLPAPSVDDSLERDVARRRSYTGSLKHFLVSMIAGKPDEEMFALYAGPIEMLTRGHGEAASLSEVTMTPDSLLGGYRFAFSGWLRVDYCGRIPRDRNYLLLRVPYARVDAHGNIITPLALQVAGPWGRSRMAEMLPLH